MTSEAARAAEQMSEGAHKLTYATRAGAGSLEHPADVYDVIGELRFMAQRLPQALGQLSAWLDSEHDEGRVGHDQGGDVTREVGNVRSGLASAVMHLANASADLSRAHSACAHLTGKE